jgi:RNA polymerase II transcription elongation factor
MTSSLEIGKRYKVDLKSDKTIVMQFMFKPASIDNSKPGLLTVDESNEALLKLPTGSLKAEPVTLKGTYITSPQTERLLVFDKETNSLSLLKISKSVIGLKHKREENDMIIKAVPRSTIKSLKKMKPAKQPRAVSAASNEQLHDAAKATLAEENAID